jgi:HEAT repeat protein
VVCQLIDDLNAPRVEVRRRAAERLARHPEAGAAAVSLVRACGDSDEQVREWAVAALEELGAPSPGDVAALVELITAACSDAAYWAATLLGRLGPPAVASVPQLARVLESEADAAVRQRAAWALGKIGPAAAAAVPALKKAAATESDPRLARLAAAAQDRINGE